MHRYRRFFVVLGAIFIQICLGAIYSWSLFNQPLAEIYGWPKDSTVLAYSLAIFVFAATTMISGRLYNRIGPQKTAAVGGILYGIGMILTAFANQLWLLYLTYGVIAGIGVGFAYVSPLTTCIRWFPRHKGFITGIAVGAFGSGSLIFKNLIEFFLNNAGLKYTFIYLGLIYATLVLIGAALLKLPPETDSQVLTRGPYEHMTFKDMIRSPRFYYMWFIYLLATMPGLLVIGLAKDIGVDLVGLDSHTAAGAVGIIALFNAGGRLIWGTASDKLGRIQVITAMLLLTIFPLLIMAFIPMNSILYHLCLIGIAFSFGGFLSVFPAITSDLFGLRHLGANYGVVFQAYGLAALVGPVIKNMASSYTHTFLIAASFGAIGLILSPLLHRHLIKLPASEKGTAV